MKQHRTKQNRIFMFLALLLALAALCQLQARIHLEASDKAIAVIMLQEDIAELSEASGEKLTFWYQTLAESGLSAVIVSEAQINSEEVVQPIVQSGLEIAQMGGKGASGLYLAPLEYDIEADPAKTSNEEIAPSQSGRIWTLVENNAQTSCVLPDGYSISDSEGPWAKGFYLRQNERSREAALTLGDAEEVGDMLFRAVADRGAQVLWITPLANEDGLNTDIQTYASLLGRLQARIERCGCHFGIPQGLEPLRLSLPVLILCGFGIFSAAILLLCLLFPIGNRVSWILFALCVLECVGMSVVKPQLQAILLAFGASIVFPALSVYFLGTRLSHVEQDSSVSISDYIKCVSVGALITVLGGIYIGAVLGSWQYILVLQVFRGVKLSQFSVYLFSIILLGVMILNLQKDSIKSALPAFDRKLLVRVISVMVILVGAGMIYLMRSGDGMLGVSSLENRFRAALENVILYRPRTKEMLIAWPAIALAFCFAARKSRLLAWLFGALGGIGFASIANTFCHIRAHFLISLARTALGLIIGLAFGTLLFFLFRPSKE